MRLRLQRGVLPAAAGLCLLLLLTLLLRPSSDPSLSSALLRCSDASLACQRIDSARRSKASGGVAESTEAIEAAEATEAALPQVLPVFDVTHADQRLVVAFTVPAEQAGRRWGLCLPRSPLLAEVRLDGRRLGAAEGLGRDALAGRSFLRPRHLALAASLGAGPHELLLSVQAPPGLAPGLGRFWVGDDDLMQRACGELADARRDVSFGITWVMSAIGLAGLLLWLRLGDRQALWFALMSLAWVFHLAWVSGFLVAEAPETWSRLFFASRVLFFPPMLLYALAVAGTPLRRLPLWIASPYLLAAGLMALLPPTAFPGWLVAMASLTLSLCVWAFVAVLHAPQAPQLRWSRWVLAAALGWVILAHLIDLQHWWRAAGYEGRAWTYLAVPGLCVAFGVRLIEELIGHARRDARDAQRLRREVDHQRVRIAADYAHLQRQREQIVVAEERRRIVRDMHDGLGAQLLSASAQLRGRPDLPPERVAEMLDDALQELRGVLDVLSTEPNDDPDDDPISALLGTLRWRMAPALRARGIELRWCSEPLPAQFLASDAARMHLLRLWQEGFTNVLKHSAARQAVFEAGVTPDGVHMTLRDDGWGFAAGQTEGIGLGSMRARAAAIGAQLVIDSEPGGGTALRVVWVLPGG